MRPEDPVTRAELACMAQRIASTVLGGPEEPAAGGFTDVPEGAWYCGEVRSAAAFGLMVGCGGGIFAPERPVTGWELREVALRLAGLLSLPAPGLSDIGEPVTRAGAVEVLCQILGWGRLEGRVAPGASDYADVAADVPGYAAIHLASGGN